MLIIEIALGIVLGYIIIANQQKLLSIGKTTFKYGLWVIAIIAGIIALYVLYEYLGKKPDGTNAVPPAVLGIVGYLIVAQFLGSKEKQANKPPMAERFGAWLRKQSIILFKGKEAWERDKYQNQVYAWVITALVTDKKTIDEVYKIDATVNWGLSQGHSPEVTATFVITGILLKYVKELLPEHPEEIDHLSHEFGDFIRDAKGALNYYCDTPAKKIKTGNDLEKLKKHLFYASGFLATMAPFHRDMAALMPPFIADMIHTMRGHDGEGPDILGLHYGAPYLELVTEAQQESEPVIEETKPKKSKKVSISKTKPQKVKI